MIEKIEIKEVPGWFACSNGKIWREKNNKFMNGNLDDSGYLRVSLYNRERKNIRFRVHRLICRAFHGDPPNDTYTVDHIDHNKLNNSPENLRWLTRQDNLAHYRNEHIMSRKVTPELVLRIRSEYKAWDRQRGAAAIAKRYGLNAGYVEDIANGRVLQYIK